MSSSVPPRRGAHRTGRSIASALLPSFLAVVAVAALITSLAVWRGQDPVQPQAAASVTTSPPDRAALSKAPDPTKAASAPARSRSAPATSAPAGSAPAGPPASAARDVQVVVLNETSRAGLAGQVADVLRGKGWKVPAVGNFRGNVADTTVYYPPGAEAAAQAAAESLPTTPRTRPRFGNLSTTRLTVVVTSSYPG